MSFLLCDKKYMLIAKLKKNELLKLQTKKYECF